MHFVNHNISNVVLFNKLIVIDKSGFDETIRRSDFES
jgi:hypothetical protein